MRTNFDISAYQGGFVMACETQEEARVFLEYLDSVGRKWCDGKPYTVTDNFDTYGNQTCYYFNEGSYGSVGFAIRYKKTILKFSDFYWEANEFNPEMTMSFDDLMNGV